MKQLILITAFLILAFGIFAIGAAARPALDTAVTLAAQPDSVADTVMRSRQTPPVAPENGRGWIVAAGLGLAGLFAAGVLAYLRFGAEFLRQRRLLTNRRSAARPSIPYPAAPFMNGQQPYQLPPSDYANGEGYSD